MADATATKTSQGKTPTKVKGRSPEEPLQTQFTNPYDRILSLQQMTGNRAVGRLLQSDNSGESTSITNLPPVVQSVLGHSEGQPLDTTTRVEMESRFNHNFSQVRVHSGTAAEQSARELNAKAYTFEQNIVFGHGKFAPDTVEGKHLLAHELAHVVQQSRGGASPVLDANAPHEAAAASAASAFINSAATVSVSGATSVGIAREPEDGAEQDTHTAKEKLAKAVVELDRLDQLAKSKTDDKALKPENTLRAYDAINSALKTASASNDKTLIAEAEGLKAQYDAITHNTPAARNVSPFQQHPLAAKDPMSVEEAHTTNTAQRGFEAGLSAGKLAEVRAEIKELEDELAKKPKAERAKQIRNKIASLNRRTAISTPTLKEAKTLQGLLKTEKDEAKRNAIQKHLRKIDKKFTGRKVTLPDLTGGSLGHSGSTYVTIQIVGPPPQKELIATIQARNEGHGKRHAEVVIRDQLKDLPNKERLKNATMIITGDQEVCKKCAPVMHEFADQHQMAPPLTNTTHAPGLTSAGKLSGKDLRAKQTTLKTSDPEKVHAIESAQRNAGVIGPKDKIKLKHIQKPLARPSKDDGGDAHHTPKKPAKSATKASAKPTATGNPKPPTPSAAKTPAKSSPAKAAVKTPASSKAAAKPAVSFPAQSPPPAPVTPTPGGSAPSSVGTQTQPTVNKVPTKPSKSAPVAPPSSTALDTDSSSTTAVQVATKPKVATKLKPSAKAAPFSSMPSPAPAPITDISPTPKPFAPATQANQFKSIAKSSPLADAIETQAVKQSSAPTAKVDPTSAIAPLPVASSDPIAVTAPKPAAAAKAAPAVSPAPKPPTPAAQAAPLAPTATNQPPVLAPASSIGVSPVSKPPIAANSSAVSPPTESPVPTAPKVSAVPKSSTPTKAASVSPSVTSLPSTPAAKATPVSFAPKPPTSAARTTPIVPTKKPPISATTTKLPAPPAAPTTVGPAPKSPTLTGVNESPKDQAFPNQKERFTTVTRSLGVIAGPNQAGVRGKAGIESSQTSAKGTKTSQTFNIGGRIFAKVDEVPLSSPPRYSVTLTIDLTADAGLSVSKSTEGRPGAGLSGSVSGSFSMSFLHQFSEEEKNKYLGAVQSGAGGASHELNLARMVTAGKIEEAKTYMAQLKASSASAAAAKQMVEGDSSSTTVGGKADAKAGISGAKLGVEVGISRSGQLQITRTKQGGKMIVTIDIVGEKGKTVGASASFGVASFGASQTNAKSQSQSVTFVLDPAAPNFDARWNELSAIDTVEDLRKAAALRPELAVSKTSGRGTSSSTVTKAGVAGVGLAFNQGGSYNEEETRDASGVTRTVQGSGTGGAALTVGDRTALSFQQTDTFKGSVGPDKKGTGETRTTKSETDLSKSVSAFGSSLEKRPIGTVAGIFTGDTKILQEKKDEGGKYLEDESFARIAELAKDPRAWEKSWHGTIDTLIAWRKLGLQIVAADGDRAQIQKLLAKFESEDSGRNATINQAVGITGAAFEFPDAISAQEPIYRELVRGNPFAHPQELAAVGKVNEATAELNTTNDKLDKLLDAIRAHENEFENPAAAAEMMDSIRKRRAALRSELLKLTPAAPKIASTDKIGPPTAEEAKAVQQQAAEAEEVAKRKARNDQINDLIRVCMSNREREQANFAAIDKEFEKEKSWFSKPDIYVITNKLNELKPMYEKWEQSLQELKGLYAERGDGAEKANQYAPNQTKWNAFHKRAFGNW